ncbi:MAG: sodium:solute symporter [Bryobacterales bacterium]|nr:sodium:solute symporter [Bryobacterales bacterium]
MRFLDLGVILLYLLGVTWFGARFRRERQTLKDYFLGGRNAPWWAISLSIVSAETSTLTIVGTPALAFGGNFAFLQVVMGYLLARVVISVILLPQYFRGQMFTAYELMQRRFGTRIRKVTASTFLVTRALAEGVRVFAISIVISIILGTGELASILVIVGLTLFYTFEGGMTAVIWTDVIQMGMYVGGAILSFFIILGKVPGGWTHVVETAQAAHKFQVFDFSFAPTAAFFAKPYSFWAGVIGGCFLTSASHGTDQLIVQRLLSARTLGESRLALFSSWVVVFVQFTLFLMIGVLLWVYFQDLHLAAPKPLDRLYPRFVWENVPRGLAGLIMAAILAAAMANLSAALNSLASTTVVDFLRPLLPNQSDERSLWQARIATVVWGVVLVAIGLVASHWGSVLESGLSIASVTLGILLGVFLLGCLTKRTGERAAITGVLAGLAVILYVKFATTIAFTWWVLIGSSATFITGYLASFVFRETIHD